MNKLKLTLIFCIIFIFSISFVNASVTQDDLLDGLESYWKLDETSGTTAVDSHGTNNGTNYGATINQVGQIDKAYDFDGTNDYVNTGANLPLGSKSASLWFRPDTTGVFGILLSRQGNIIGSTDKGLTISIYSDNKVYCYVGQEATGAQHLQVSSTTIISVGTWYHVSCVQTSAGLYLYLNGNLDGSSTTKTGTEAATTNINIGVGGLTTNSRWFDGRIDEVAIYNRSLNSTEVTALYDIQKDGYTSGSYNFSALVPETNFTITAENIHTNNTINNFSVIIDSINYNTTNGTITTHILQNSTSLWDINISSDGYFNRTYTNYNVSNDTLIAELIKINFNQDDSITTDPETPLFENYTITINSVDYVLGKINYTTKTDGYYPNIYYNKNLTEPFIISFDNILPSLNLISPLDNYFINEDVSFIGNLNETVFYDVTCNLYDNRTGIFENRTEDFILNVSVDSFETDFDGWDYTLGLGNATRINNYASDGIWSVRLRAALSMIGGSTTQHIIGKQLFTNNIVFDITENSGTLQVREDGTLIDTITGTHTNYSVNITPGSVISFRLSVGMDPTLVYIDNIRYQQFVKFNETDIVSTEGTFIWTIKCEDELGNQFTTENRTIIIDTTNPLINLKTDLNYRLFNVTPITLEYEISDDNLFGYNFTCYNSSDNIIYTEQNISLTEKEINYSQTLTFNSPGINRCVMTAVDDHTINEINFITDIKKESFFSSKEYIDINGGDLKIKATDGSINIESINYKTELDRISPIIKLKEDTSKSLNGITIEGSKETDYINFIYEVEFKPGLEVIEITNSKYMGHYVILGETLKDSYWVDLESDYNSKTFNSYVIDNKIIYEISVSKNEAESKDYIFKTNSIGGLNVGVLETLIEIEEGYNLTINGINHFNLSLIPINITLNNGSLQTYNNEISLTIPVGCERYNITLTSNNYMNTEYNIIEGCNGNLELNHTFWQSELDIEVRNIISSNLILNSSLNITNQGTTKIYNITGSNYTLKLNSDLNNFLIAHNNYGDYLENITLINGLNPLKLFYLIPVYNISMLREEDGSDFDFTEKTDFYECLNRTENITKFELQNTANSVLCEGNWSLENSCEDAYDGLSSTYGKPMNNLNATLYLNYTKPSSSTNVTYFETRKDFLNIKNYTMGDYLGCWNQANLQFKYESDDIASTTKLYCKNSTDWHLMDTYYNNGYVYYQNLYWGYNDTEDIYDTCENVEDMNVVVKTFCDNKVITNILSRTKKELTGIDCNYHYWYIRADYKDTSYYRTVIPDKDIFNHNLYMLDLNLDIAVQIILNIKDLTGEYVGSKIRLYKFINDEKKIVIEQYLDIENRVILWLDQNEIYEVYIVKSNGVETYIGDLLADQASTKQLTIPAIMLAGGGGLNNLNFYYTNINKNAGTLGWYYKDSTSGGPSSITWQVSDKNGVIVYQNSSTTSKEVLFIATGLDQYKDYYSKLIIEHNDYGKITENRPVWYATATDFPGFGETDIDGNNNVALIFKLIVAILVPLFILLLFSQSTTEIGMTMSLIMMFIFLQLDWYAYLLGKVPFGSGIMTVLLSVFGILLAFMWLRKSRREE